MFSEISNASKILWSLGSRNFLWWRGSHMLLLTAVHKPTASWYHACKLHPTQALFIELWFNNPCISSDLQKQLVELQEELQRHNCGVNVPVPQLKWFMQHLVTMMSARTWLSSLNQSLKHYAEFVYQSKPQNATYPWKFTLIFPWDAVYHSCFGREKLRRKYPCTVCRSISFHSSGFKSLWDVKGCLLSMKANTTQRTTCLNKLQ